MNKPLVIPDKKAKTTVIASLVLQILLRTKFDDSYTLVGFTNQVAVDKSTLEDIWGENGTSQKLHHGKLTKTGP